MDNCLDCGKKISEKKWKSQEGMCDDCYKQFLEDVSQEAYPEDSFGD